MILTLLIVMPLVGALAVLATPRDDSGLQKGVALGASLVTFLASLPLFFAFQTYTPDFQFTMDRAWLADLGLRYQVGLDGLSLFLVLLTTFLVPVVLLASWNAIEERVKLFLIAMLVMESATIGAFVTTNLFFFYMFWEATLIPLYLMIGVFGSGNKIRSANKFFLFTLAGSLLMLAGIVYLGLEHTRQLGYPSLYVNDLMRLKLNGEQQNWLFLAFMLAFAIKVPMFPVHTWLPDAHTDAPTAGSVMLAGVMLKLGTYGVLRFALPLFPAAAAQYAEFFSWLAAIGIVYGALVAWIQPDIKRLIAYSSVSHLGFVMLGIFSGTLEGASGAVLQMITHGISTGALFLCVGVLYERRHTRLLDEYGGLARRMPIVNVTGHALSVFNNCLLIRQAAGAPLTIVGGFKQWLAAGRVVMAGQHGYAIWYPRGKRKAADDTADDEKRSAVSFGTATVFDISQTVALGPVSADIESAPLSICYGDTVIAKRLS